MSEVLVVGGGIIGCGIARALSVRGRRVILVDPREVGQGASRASAGMLAPFTEGQHDHALQVLGIRSLELYNGLVADLAAEGAEVEYTRNGSVDIGLDPEDDPRIDAMGATLAGAGVAHERYDAKALAATEPGVTKRARGGLRLSAQGAVDVPALVRALWRSASSRGASTSPRRQAPSSRPPAACASRPRLELSKGHMSSWRPDAGQGRSIAARLVRPPVVPVRGQLLVLGLREQVLRHALWGPRCYLVPWRDGTVLVGATVEDAGFDERATAEGVDSLLRAAIELVPALAGASFEGVRVGLRPGTPDHRPIVGPSSRMSRLIYATGHYRNGALLAPLTADAVAGLVEGTPLDAVWGPCAPARFGL